MRQLSKTYAEFAALAGVEVKFIEKCVNKRLLRADKKRKRIYMDVLSAMFLDSALKCDIKKISRKL